MSSSKPRGSTRIAAIVALSAVAVMASACGYQPLYGQNAVSTAAREHLASIELAPMADRVGQQMHTALERRLHITGQAAQRYSLAVGLDESLQTLAGDKAGNVTRANLSIKGTYMLTRKSDGALLLKGTTRQVASYNLLESEFATLAAKKDARERAIDLLADDIVTRLAIYFRGPYAEGKDVRP